MSHFISIVLQINAGEPLKYKLNDGNEIPAVALGTSLGHLADVSFDKMK